MQSFLCLRLLVLVLVVTAANATRRRKDPAPTGHPYTSAARKYWKQCVSEGGTKNCAKVQPASLRDMCMDPFATHVDPNTHVYTALPEFTVWMMQCSGTDSGSLDCAAPNCDNNQCSKDCPEYFTAFASQKNTGPRFFQVESGQGNGFCERFSLSVRLCFAPSD